ncbi:MAG: hypothetical protein K0R28_4183 [Paenibacillus sp.]|jgi:glucose/arabinose dehydrogenase|nr:hypothetical protein [Paenibacillus sp.]
MPFYSSVVYIAGMRILRGKDGKLYVKMGSRGKVRKILKDRKPQVDEKPMHVNR